MSIGRHIAIGVADQDEVAVALDTRADIDDLAILGRADNDGQLVQIEAELLQRVSQSVRPRLLLQNGSITFAAMVKNAADAKKLVALEPGSRLRVIGICAMQGGENHEPVSFRLLVDDRPDEIKDADGGADERADQHPTRKARQGQ